MAEFVTVGEQFAVKSLAESKETWGVHLKIARLLSPTKFPHLIASIVGIPFEENQLKSCAVNVDGQRVGLLQMMGQMDLIGATDGVPHLSVGGSWQKRDEDGDIIRDKHGNVILVDSNISRSYLVGDGRGVKGMGLVRYDRERGQSGFGLDERITRTYGFDIGGRLGQRDAREELLRSRDLWLLSFLDTGHSCCAFVFDRFDYQLRYEEGSKGFSSPTSIIIREDGSRGVAKKELTPAIYEALPILTDFFIYPLDFFQADGHNAFLRDGKVIFTDFEMVDFDNTYVDFIDKLSNEWFFEELRKAYPRFLSLYGLRPTGDIDYNNLQEVIAQLTKIEDREGFDKVRKATGSKDRKAIVRYAMAGVIRSHANLRLLGRYVLSEIIKKSIWNDHARFNTTLEDLESILREVHYPDISREGIDDGFLGIQRDEHGNLSIRGRLNTFGLPINPDIAISITRADIYKAWQRTIFGDSQKGDITQRLSTGERGDDVFVNLPNDLFSNTIYTRLADMFSGARIMSRPSNTTILHGDGVDKQEFDRGRLVYTKSFEQVFSPCTFRVDDRVEIIINGDSITINALKSDIDSFDIADLNKIAYIIHVTQEYLAQQRRSEIRTIDIEV